MTTRRGFIGAISAGLAGIVAGLESRATASSATSQITPYMHLSNLSAQQKQTNGQHNSRPTHTLTPHKGAYSMSNGAKGENLYRPPYLKRYRSTDAPLTVLSTLLSRADNSPLSERRRDPNLLLDQKGQLVENPVMSSNTLALETDPNVGFEKWCKYWRKVHGARFIHALQGDGIQDLLRYDQLHRIPSGPTSFDPPPYLAPVDKHAELFDTVIGHIEPYRRPQWDGIAYLTFESFNSLKSVLGKDKVRTKIFPEDQAIFRELTPVITSEYVILPSVTQRDPIILVKTHVCHSGINRKEFLEKWLNHHASLVLSKPSTHLYVKRYAQLHNVGPTAEGEPLWNHVASKIDGVSIMAFSSMNDVEDFLMSDDYIDIANDENVFSDPKQSEYWTALAHNVVNQLHPERSTHL